MTGICVLATTFTMTLIAFSRYVLVAHPRRSADLLTFRVNLSLCGVAWALAAVVQLLSQTGWSDTVFNAKTHACSFVRDDGSYQHFLLSSGIVVPLLVICLFYILLFSAVQRDKNKVKNGLRTMTSSVVRTTAMPACECIGAVVRELSSVALPTNTDLISPTTASDRRAVGSRSLTVLRAEAMKLCQTEADLDNVKTRSSVEGMTRLDVAQADRRVTKVDIALTKTMVIIFVGLVLCFFFYYLVNIVDKRACFLPIWVHKLATWFLDLHSCINPIIYRLRNRRFKEDCSTSRCCICIRGRKKGWKKTRKEKEKRKQKDAAMNEEKEDEI